MSAKYRYEFTVPQSGTFYTKHHSTFQTDVASIHLYSKDSPVVTDCQFQTSNWSDERDLSGSVGNKYWYTEPSASISQLVTERFTGSADTSTVSHIGNIGSRFWRLKLTCDAGGVFVMNFQGKE